MKYARVSLIFVLCAGLTSSNWAEDVQTTVVVDTARSGAPINPYLYGQFIEHAGRCIHDGIWAEMLQDRKCHWEPGYLWAGCLSLMPARTTCMACGPIRSRS